MAQLTVEQAKQLNKINHSTKKLGLGDIIRGLQGGTLVQVSGTDGQIAIFGSNGVPVGKTVSGDITITDLGVTLIGANAILAGKIKIVNRDLVVAIGAISATVTNPADINGIPLDAFFTAAVADVTATEIRSKRFVPTTGALTVTLNATATAATTVRVPIIQAV